MISTLNRRNALENLADHLWGLGKCSSFTGAGWTGEGRGVLLPPAPPGPAKQHSQHNGGKIQNRSSREQ
ncbi:hypothetical protein E2C01_032869 [Portunus trituberculatus]|uniref:Uncharacterized protein n=1 Tax=Portunus trituberculatus TaxID=210409 RepID=A0A5B7F1W3_PORTR|nr:hypothetical protein [Portunus trituberculatus]